jgi:glucuronate isomerase
MAEFLDDDFLLQSPTARRLYHEYAKDEPIFDYHCHLIPSEIAGNRRWETLTDIWLGGDHYKWRLMRANGIPESHCTGDADPYDKFLAFARTLPWTIRNPIYVWSHLELRRYFGITTLLSEETAPAIWEEANARLADTDFCAHGILKKFKVKGICTTDDPADSLEHHERCREIGLETGVYPTFRPDAAFKIGQPDVWRKWLNRLSGAVGLEIHTYHELLEALQTRHSAFHSFGARLSDHGLNHLFNAEPDPIEAARIFARVYAGQTPSASDEAIFGITLMDQFGRWDAQKGWTKQLHLGAMRSVNTRLSRQLGPDTGFDSIGDWLQGEALARYLDRLDQDKHLPKVILYNLNPRENYLLSTMAGNFMDGTIAGKVQFGSGWWFLDQKEGMEWQMNALSMTGLIGRFVGMLTDSRSFLSYPRHEYFRRILCNLVGTEADRGELPADIEMLGTFVRRICFQNAAEFIGVDLP